MWKILESLLKQSEVGQSRSSVINPLQWTLVIVTFALLAFAAVPHIPARLVIGAACADGSVLAALLGAYVFFMITDPDALRSEKYALVKTAIERRLLGDSLTGLSDAIETLEAVEKTPLGPRP